MCEAGSELWYLIVAGLAPVLPVVAGAQQVLPAAAAAAESAVLPAAHMLLPGPAADLRHKNGNPQKTRGTEFHTLSSTRQELHLNATDLAFIMQAV
jgi:hypothetical protein